MVQRIVCTLVWICDENYQIVPPSLIKKPFISILFHKKDQGYLFFKFTDMEQCLLHAANRLPCLVQYGTNTVQTDIMIIIVVFFILLLGK